MVGKEHTEIQNCQHNAAIPKQMLLNFPNFVDPIQATFSGGAKDPFRRWYSYLEGYSPEFVETILRRFSPEAQTVLDPFSGTGTTAFVTAKRGIRSLSL